MANAWTIELAGRIDSGNAASVEESILAQLDGAGIVPIVLDAAGLEYISSAGLRVLLRLRKKYPDIVVTGVRSEIYEIFEMTGFTEMMNVEKAYRVVSVEGCEVIGQGANGTIYRIDRDNVVKVYNNADVLADIQHIGAYFGCCITGVCCQLCREIACSDILCGYISFYISGSDFVPAVLIHALDLDRAQAVDLADHAGVSACGTPDIYVIVADCKTGGSGSVLIDEIFLFCFIFLFGFFGLLFFSLLFDGYIFKTGDCAGSVFSSKCGKAGSLDCKYCSCTDSCDFLHVKFHFPVPPISFFIPERYPFYP